MLILMVAFFLMFMTEKKNHWVRLFWLFWSNSRERLYS